MLIITHTAPDLDAALGTWIAARYWRIADEPVLFGFVPAGATHDEATMVIDTGRVYNAAARRYDHHMPELANDTSISAASLIYQASLAVYQPDAAMFELEAIRR